MKYAIIEWETYSSRHVPVIVETGKKWMLNLSLLAWKKQSPKYVKIATYDPFKEQAERHYISHPENKMSTIRKIVPISGKDFEFPIGV